MEQITHKAQGTNCECCHRDFQKRLRSEKRALQTIVLVEKPPEHGFEPDVEQLVANVLEPLANPARLRILFATSAGKKGFSRLSQLTGLKGGHLIFHLRKLLDAGFIVQEDNKGDYLITQRGLDVAKKIVTLQT
jgi:DNA-binding transcriptional ArsR family regulator